MGRGTECIRKRLIVKNFTFYNASTTLVIHSLCRFVKQMLHRLLKIILTAATEACSQPFRGVFLSNVGGFDKISAVLGLFEAFLPRFLSNACRFDKICAAMGLVL